MLTNRQDSPVALHPGVIVSRRAEYKSRRVNGAAPTPKISRITLSSSTATAVSVTATLGGDSRTVSTTFVGSVDATNSAALLVALRGDPLFMAFFASVAAGTSTANDVTGIGAQEPVITVSGVGISVSVTQAAAASAALSYGRFYPVGARSTTGELTATAVGSTSALSGPVLTFTATWDDAADNYSIAGVLIGPKGEVVTISESGSAGANLPAFLVNVNADLTSEIPGATVTTASPAVVWALPVGWQVTTMQASADSDSDLAYTLTDAGDTAPSVVGLAHNEMNDEFADFAGTYKTSRPADQGVTLIVGGAQVSVPLASGVTVTDGDDVWVETTAGANYGLCYPTPSPSRYHPAGAVFVAPSTDAIGVVGV